MRYPEKWNSALVSWDPGILASGLAVFEGDRLVSADCIKVKTQRTRALTWATMAKAVAAHAQGAERFVFEQMSTRKGREDAHADLIELSITSGIIAGLLDVPFLPVPANTWTKRRQKVVNAARVREILAPPELRALDAGIARCSTKENHKEIYDAVGIGLYALRRWS